MGSELYDGMVLGGSSQELQDGMVLGSGAFDPVVDPFGFGAKSSAGVAVATPGLVDGDTLRIDGVKHRFQGVDTPELSDNEPYAQQAADFTQQFIQDGVTTESAENRLDPYGRPISYIRSKDQLLNEELLRQGLGRAMLGFDYDDSQKARFLEAQQEAREAGRGVWAEGEEQPITPVPSPRELTLEEQTQLVEQRLEKLQNRKAFALQMRDEPGGRGSWNPLEMIKQGYNPLLNVSHTNKEEWESKLEELDLQIPRLQKQLAKLKRGERLTELREEGVSQNDLEVDVYKRRDEQGNRRLLDGPLFVEDFDPDQLRAYQTGQQDTVREYAAHETLVETDKGKERRYKGAIRRVADELGERLFNSIVQARYRWAPFASDPEYADLKAAEAAGRSRARRYFQSTGSMEAMVNDALDSVTKSAGAAAVGFGVGGPPGALVAMATTYAIDEWNSSYNSYRQAGIDKYAAEGAATVGAAAEVGVMLAFQATPMGGLEKLLSTGGKAAAQAAAQPVKANLRSLARRAGEAVGPLSLQVMGEVLEESLTTVIQANVDAETRGVQLTAEDLGQQLKHTAGTTLIAMGLAQAISRGQNSQWRGSVQQFLKDPSRKNLKQLGWLTLQTENDVAFRTQLANTIDEKTAQLTKQNFEDLVAPGYETPEAAQEAFSGLVADARAQGMVWPEGFSEELSVAPTLDDVNAELQQAEPEVMPQPEPAPEGPGEGAATDGMNAGLPRMGQGAMGPTRPQGRGGQWLGAQSAWQSMWTRAVAKDPSDKRPPVALRDIMAAIKGLPKALGVKTPIRKGLHDDDGLGYFFGKKGVIRLRSMEDIAVAMHEIGHLAMRSWGVMGRNVVKYAPQETLDELRAAGQKMYTEGPPHNGWHDEGFAEYMRVLAIHGAERVAKDFPEFHPWFMGKLAEKPKVQQQLFGVMDLIVRYANDGALRNTLAQFDRKKPLLERIKAQLTPDAAVRFRDWFRDHLDEKTPVHDIEEDTIDQYEQLAGGNRKLAWLMLQRDVKSLQDGSAWDTARFSRMRGNTIVTRFVREGRFNVDNVQTGESLTQALSSLHGLKVEDVLGQRYGWEEANDIHKLFEAYLLAWQTVAEMELAQPTEAEKAVRRRKTTRAQPQDDRRATGLALETAKDVIAQLNHPAFEQARDRLYEWWEGVQDYISQISPEHAQQVAKVRAFNVERFGVRHGYYIPLERVIDFEALGGYARNATGLKTPIVDRAKLSKATRKGGDQPIKPPLEQLIINATELIDAAHHRRVVDMVFDMHEARERLGALDLDKAHWIEEIPEGQVPMDLPLKEAVGKMAEVMVAAGIDKDVAKRARGAILQIVEDTGLKPHEAFLTWWMNDGQAKWGWRENPMFPRGKTVIDEYGNTKEITQFYRVHPRLFDWLSNAKESFWSSFGRTYKVMRTVQNLAFWVTRHTKAAYIGLNPEFLLATSPAREFSAYMYHSTGNPGQNLVDYLQSLGEVVLYSFTKMFNTITLGRTPVFQTKLIKMLVEQGVTMSGEYASDPAGASQLAREATKTVGRAEATKLAVKEILGAMGQMDLAPRLAAARAELRKRNWDIDDMLSEKRLKVFTLTAKEITADFTAGSPASRYWNGWFMFYNITLQGPRFSAKHFQDHKGEFLSRMLAFIGLELGLWWINKDEEWWKERNRKNDIRERRFLINGEVYRAPRNQEVDMIAAGVVALADAWYQREPETVKTYMADVIQQFIPDQLLFKYAFEQATNTELYLDVPIVPEWIESAEIPEQYKHSSYTTEAAKKIGAIIKQSPARIQHTIKFFTGNMGLTILETADYAMDKAGLATKREWETADIPIVGRFFQRGGPLGSRPKSVDDVTKLAARMQGMYQYVDKNETPQERAMRLYIRQSAELVGAYLSIRSFATDRYQMRQLTQLAVDTAQQALDDYKHSRLRSVAGKRKRAEAFKRALQATDPQPDPQPLVDQFLDQ